MVFGGVKVAVAPHYRPVMVTSEYVVNDADVAKALFISLDPTYTELFSINTRSCTKTIVISAHTFYIINNYLLINLFLLLYLDKINRVKLNQNRHN